MGDEHEERYAARRAAFERLFQELPPAGTAAYWQRIEQAPKEAALPLEVLARCLRERWSAGAHQHAKRIFECMLRRIQSRTTAWAWSIARQCHIDQHQMQQDLQQACHTELWEELIDDGPTFLLENFLHALDRIQRHVAHASMEQAGEWKRTGVKTPTRIPPQITGSLFEQVDPEEELTREEILGDPNTQKAFDQAELSGDIIPFLKLGVWGVTEQKVALMVHPLNGMP